MAKENLICGGKNSKKIDYYLCGIRQKREKGGIFR